MESEDEGEAVLDQYVLGKKIGQGTFAKVRVAVHTPTGEKVAVKILKKAKLSTEEDVNRLAREVNILKKLRHNNLIQLYEIIESPEEINLVTEFVEGGELFHYIVENERIREKEASLFLLQILAGVEYLHRLGVVHRDLKAENILLDQRRTIKIIDFGLSNTYKPGEKVTTACGSPCYAAPEMIKSLPYNGLEVDIWSCGVIMFAMICGYLPFEDNNDTKKLYRKIMNGEFDIPEFVSPFARDLLKRMLTVDPARRYRLDEIRAHSWFGSQVYRELGVVVNKEQLALDEKVLAKLAEFGYGPSEARSNLLKNRHNKATTLYYLLLEKQCRLESRPCLRHVSRASAVAERERSHTVGTTSQDTSISGQYIKSALKDQVDRDKPTIPLSGSRKPFPKREESGLIREEERKEQRAEPTKKGEANKV
jgi:5'-AMP-activated protein kinase catalytic alpha subunit